MNAGAAEVMRVDGLAVHFGGVRAVDGIDLAVGREQIVGLIGPNGAGKTTVINAMTGFQKPTAGRVIEGSHDVSGWSPERLARHGIARTFQGVRTFRGLSVRENVELGAVARGIGRRQAHREAHALLERLSMTELADLPAGSLAQGDERSVGIARALALRPRYLLLDEPVAGLNQAEADAIARLIAWIRDDCSCGVLVVEHNVRFIMGLCDRIHAMSYGETISEGAPAEIRKDPRVIAAYLGGAAGRRAERTRAGEAS
jgi:branched-chain amino acid transport system ATP-binding protein